MFDEQQSNDPSDSLDFCLEVKKTLEEFLTKMNIFFYRVEVFKGLSAAGPRFMIQSEHSGLLIGRTGENLKALNYLLRKILRKKYPQARFIIDVDGYQEDNLNKLKELALAAAGRAQRLKVRVELPPMSAYERLTVHTFFSNHPAVTTESVGEKNKRRITIKPR